MVSEQSGKEAAFRKWVRDWRKANLPKGWGTPEYRAPERQSEAAQVLGEQWTKTCCDAGYAGFGYPKGYGNRVHLYFKRSRALDTVNGDANYHREIIAKHYD